MITKSKSRRVKEDRDVLGGVWCYIKLQVNEKVIILNVHGANHYYFIQDVHLYT